MGVFARLDRKRSCREVLHAIWVLNGARPLMAGAKFCVGMRPGNLDRRKRNREAGGEKKKREKEEKEAGKAPDARSGCPERNTDYHRFRV